MKIAWWDAYNLKFWFHFGLSLSLLIVDLNSWSSRRNSIRIVSSGSIFVASRRVISRMEFSIIPNCVRRSVSL